MKELSIGLDTQPPFFRRVAERVGFETSIISMMSIFYKGIVSKSRRAKFESAWSFPDL